MMTVHHPLVLLLIPLLAWLVLYGARRRTPAAVRFSSAELVSGLPQTFRARSLRSLPYLRVLAVALLVAGLARPQSILEEVSVETQGIDIVLVVDLSTSMLAEDFSTGRKRQNRLDAVKAVVREFIRGRKGDRIGMVAFASRPYTASPLTLDYEWLSTNLDRLHIGMIEDGTAIGQGLASALNRLKDTSSRGKVAILLTDGRNNMGDISPITAAEAARAVKVKVYTIGAGSKGPVPFPVKDVFGNTVYRQVEIDMDEDTLQQIADKTGGKYYQATDANSLKKIYEDINKLEKTGFKEKQYYRYTELFHYFVVPGLVLLLLEVLLSNTMLRRIP